MVNYTLSHSLAEIGMLSKETKFMFLKSIYFHIETLIKKMSKNNTLFGHGQPS